MIDLDPYILDFTERFVFPKSMQPWDIIENLELLLQQHLKNLGAGFTIENNRAIHSSATIEPGVTMKGLVIISENCFIGANAYLRGPLYFGPSVRVGPGSEVKQSMVFDHTAMAHFNYIGNSLVGHHINFEAGSICANHFNERTDKTIFVIHEGERINTGVTKFGSLIGDHSKIGANAVLSPGTLLDRNSVVRRLALIEQDRT